MALASVVYPTDGVTNQFHVPFFYISKTHVHVYINDVEVGFSWFNDTTIQFAAAPSAGLLVKIARVTPVDSRLVNFEDGTILTEKSLNLDGNQAHFLIQEMRDDLDSIEAGILGQTTIDEITQNAISGATNNVLSSSTITTLQSDVADALAQTGGNVTYYQPTAPATHVAGDLWLDTDDGNKLYRSDGTSWVVAQDAAIQQALTEAGNAQATADGKIVTFAQPTAPTADGIGDIWIDTSNFNKLHRWTGVGWVEVTPESLKITMSATAPANPKINDIWYNTSDNNKSYQWDGTLWQPLVTTIHGSLVVDGTIVGSKILAGAIGASHLSVTRLDAISANMGTITTGALTLTSIGTHRLEISSHATYPLWYGSGAVNDANGRFYIKADGTAVFKGALSAATGTFAGALSAATGTFYGSGTFSGALSAATGTFSGSLTASAVNAVNTINIAGQAVSVQASYYMASAVGGGASEVSLASAYIVLTAQGLSSVFIQGHFLVTGSGSSAYTAFTVRVRRGWGGPIVYEANMYMPKPYNSYTNQYSNLPIPVAVVVKDDPGAGGHTYYLTVQNGANSYTHRALLIQSAKSTGA